MRFWTSNSNQISNLLPYIPHSLIIALASQPSDKTQLLVFVREIQHVAKVRIMVSTPIIWYLVIILEIIEFHANSSFIQPPCPHFWLVLGVP